MKAQLILAGLLLSTLPGMAQTDPVPQDKLYVTDPAACSLLESQGVGAFETLDFLTLSFTDGIQGMEFHCNFFDVKTRPGNTFTLVTAVCEAPGESYPDLLSIGVYNDDTIQVTSMADTSLAQIGAMAMQSEAAPTDQAEQTPAPTGITLYHRCDNLSELPR